MINAHFYKAYEDNTFMPFLKYYKDERKCCRKYPKCDHPREQSDSFLFERKQETIQYLKRQFYDSLKKQFGELTVKEEKFWILYVPANKPTPAIWHKHFQDKYERFRQISGITYITETEIGTEFATDFYKITIRPKPFCWYTWDSNIMHRPEEGQQATDRYIIAGQTVIDSI